MAEANELIERGLELFSRNSVQRLEKYLLTINNVSELNKNHLDRYLMINLIYAKIFKKFFYFHIFLFSIKVLNGITILYV